MSRSDSRTVYVEFRRWKSSGNVARGTVARMLEHYKKRFWGMQIVIATVTLGVFFATHHILVPAAMFFFTMQLGAVVGAAWATRLKRKYQARGW